MKKTLFTFLIICLLSLGVSFAADIVNSEEMISPRGMCYDEQNSRIIVADSVANAIFEVDINTLKVKHLAGVSAGTDMYGLPVGGYIDGKLDKAMFSAPSDVAVLKNGTIIVADTGNHAIRQIYNGEVSTIAGGKNAGFADGYRQGAEFNCPSALAILADGSLLVSDTENDAIRKISDTGKVTTLAVQVRKPAGIYVGEKEIFVCELETSSVLIFKENDKKATNILGGTRGFVNDIAERAKFAAPSDIVVFNSAYYIADTGNHALRKVYVTTSNGGRAADTLLGGRVGFDDGENLLLDGPKSVLVAAGQLFVSDTNNGRLLRLGNPKALQPVRNYEKCEQTDTTEIYVNGVKLRFADVRPFFVNNRTYIPFRVIAESLGGAVTWIQSERAVLCKYGETELKFTEQNGLIFRNERAFVPLRLVAESFGMEVNWLGELWIVEINSLK